MKVLPLSANILLIMLFSTLTACGNEARNLKGDTGTLQSISNSEQDKQANQGEEGKVHKGGASNDIADSEEAKVTPPKAISGAYLTCPLVDEDETSASFACKYADSATHARIPDEALFKSVTPKVTITAAGLKVNVQALSRTALWSHLISVSFASKAQKASLLPSVSIEVETVAFDNSVSREVVDPSSAPEARKGSGIRNVNPGDYTYMGFYAGADDPLVLSERAVGAFSSPSGISTQWKHDADGKIRNPLGYCLTDPSIVSKTALYIDCEAAPAATYERNGRLIRITSGNYASKCLTVKTISTRLFVGAEGPKYYIDLADCDNSNPNQRWEAFDY